MGIVANGWQYRSTGLYHAGATQVNNANPSAHLGNFNQPGRVRNISAGQAITSTLVGIPSGDRHPNCWMMPRSAGALAARNQLTGTGTISATALAVKLAEASLTGSGELSAIGSLIVQAVAAITGSGTITAADLKAFLQAQASLTGTGTVSATATGLGALAALLTGSGTSATSTLTGTGELEAALVVTGTGLTTGNVGAAVWSAIATANNTAGTMGEKLNDAGSASNPWTEVIESGYTAAEILKLLAAVAQGDASGLTGSAPVFKSIDGTKDRVTATQSGGTRTVTARDVS